MRHQLEVWNPFRGFSDFNALWENAVPEAFQPATDIEETGAQYLLSVDLPGVKKEDIKIEVKEGNLFISGERKTEKKEDKGTRRFFEKTYGKFERVFALGTEISADGIEAAYQEGVLKVTVPKAEAVKPKLIPVRE